MAKAKAMVMVTQVARSDWSGLVWSLLGEEKHLLYYAKVCRLRQVSVRGKFCGESGEQRGAMRVQSKLQAGRGLDST